MLLYITVHTSPSKKFLLNLRLEYETIIREVVFALTCLFVRFFQDKEFLKSKYPTVDEVYLFTNLRTRTIKFI